MLAAPVPAARRWSPLPAAPRRPPRSRLGAAAATETPPAPSREQLYASLEAAIEGVRQLPPSQRRAGGEEAAAGVRSALSGLRSLGAFSLFGCAPPPQRRTIAQYELRSAGIKEPEAIGRPSIRNDAAFLGARARLPPSRAGGACVGVASEQGAHRGTLVWRSISPRHCGVVLVRRRRRARRVPARRLGRVRGVPGGRHVAGCARCWLHRAGAAGDPNRSLLQLLSRLQGARGGPRRAARPGGAGALGAGCGRGGDRC